MVVTGEIQTVSNLKTMWSDCGGISVFSGRAEENQLNRQS
jgi:hypothetical protein